MFTKVWFILLNFWISKEAFGVQVVKNNVEVTNAVLEVTPPTDLNEVFLSTKEAVKDGIRESSPTFKEPTAGLISTELYELTSKNLEATDSYELLFAPERETLAEINKQVMISYGCPVNHSRPCVSKCCDLHQTHTNFSVGSPNRTECVSNIYNVDFWLQFADCPQHGWNSSIPLYDRYEYFIGIPCTTGKYILDPNNYPEDEYLLYSNGSLFYAGRFFDMSDYCVDTVDGKNRAFVCFESAPAATAEFYHILYPVGQLISIPFLLATALVYVAIEKFRDLPGKSLVCHVLSLTVAFFFLALVQLAGPDLNQAVCVAAAFIIQFSFVACFFWLNVLSYDTYRNIQDNFYRIGSASTEKRKFILYSLYAWNGPMILFIVSLVIDRAPGIPDSMLKPQFGTRSCWFSSETAALPYFFGPVGILLAINLLFFTMSAYTIIKEKRAAAKAALDRLEDEDETERDKKKRKRHRKLMHYIKGLKQCFSLFIIMGLSWLAEVISWAIGGPRYVWVTTDVINTLQGILIFIVFVYRPVRVRNAVSKHLTRVWGIVTHCDCTYRRVDRYHEPVPTTMPIPTTTSQQDIRDGENRNTGIVLSTFHPDQA